MPLKDRHAGEPFSPSASEHNELVRAVRLLMRERGTGTNPAHASAGRVEFSVRNDTEADLDRFGVLDVTEPIFTHADNPDEFWNRVAFKGAEPSATTRGRIAIALGPIADGAIGRAVFAGVVVCKVDVTDANTTFAAEISGDAEKLRTRAEGGIEILWRESGSSGTKWAVVRIGGGSRTARGQHVIQSAASVAASSPPRWKYTIKRGVTDAATGLVSTESGAPACYAYDLDEDTSDADSYQHNQSLSPGGGTLTPGPLKGRVDAFYSGVNDADGTPIYHFSNANPMTVDCP